MAGEQGVYLGRVSFDERLGKPARDFRLVFRAYRRGTIGRA